LNTNLIKEVSNGNSILDRHGVNRRYARKIHHAGKDPGGCIITILIGIAGAFVGGFIGSRLGIGTFTGFHLRSILLAVVVLSSY